MNNTNLFYPNKNYLFSKIKIEVLSIFSLSTCIIYFTCITATPLFFRSNHQNDIVKTYNFGFSVTKKISLANPKQARAKIFNIDIDKQISTVTYLKNNAIFIRQIDDDNAIQSYISSENGTILKLFGDNENLNYNYDAYGTVIMGASSPENNIANPIMYNGQRFDDNTGLQYLRARFYEPGIERFISEDSSILFNRFNYANANPVMNQDPSGKISITNLVCGIFNIVVAGVLLLREKDFTGAALNFAFGVVNTVCGGVDNSTARKISAVQTGIIPFLIIPIYGAELAGGKGRRHDFFAKEKMTAYLSILETATGSYDTFQLIKNGGPSDQNPDDDPATYFAQASAMIGFALETYLTSTLFSWRSKINKKFADLLGIKIETEMGKNIIGEKNAQIEGASVTAQIEKRNFHEASSALENTLSEDSVSANNPQQETEASTQGPNLNNKTFIFTNVLRNFRNSEKYSLDNPYYQ